MTTVGVIGLGAMGSRMAARLLGAGFIVHGYNRSAGRSPELDELGLIREPSPAAVAAECEVLIIMLWDSEAVEEVLAGRSGVFERVQRGAVIVNTSTIESAVSARLAAWASRLGASLLDAPVSGSLDRAETGTLLTMVGGSSNDLERVRPILETFADRVVHVGPAGSGLAIKLAVNLQVAIQLVAWGESLAITDQAGLDRRRASAVMLQSVIASPMLHYRIPFTLDEPVDVWANASQLLKDVEYARAAGAGGLATEQARVLLSAVVAAGRGGKEAAELVEEAARMAVTS
jgi:3-hydroxyisobutyrate dehydrogenase-like beta-hydroxyacid dehydrogenase